MRAVATAARVSGATNTSLLPSGIATAKPTAACRVGAFSRARPGRRPRGVESRVRAMSAKETFVTTTAPETLRKLQNGSDVRGVALEGVEGEPVTLNEEAAFLIAEAFAEWLARKMGVETKDVVVAVGRDPRLSGPALANASFAGFANAGCARVVDLGLATTPACFVSTVTASTDYDAAVMLTASHLPFNRNGAKFFTKDGGLDKTDIAAICAAAAEKCAAAPGGHAIPSLGEDGATAVDIVEHAPFLPTYAEQLRALIAEGVGTGARPLRGFKIAVDAGNGSGGFFATDVLEPLGADVSGSQFLDPDGTFPNHSPNPEDPEAMASAARATSASGADLGVVFDTDVDRSAVIDASGVAFNRNRLIALLAAIVLAEHPGSTVVTDSVTSDGLAAFIEARGGKHLRYMRGYKNVIDKGRALDAAGEPCHLMIETSGHGAMKENYNLDDGAYLAVKIIIEAVRRKNAGGKGVGDLLSDLREPLEEAEARLKIQSEDFKTTGARLVRALEEEVLKGDAGAFSNASPVAVNHEGYRVRVDEGGGKFGWFLLRQSLHDPVCVLNFESEKRGGVKVLAREFTKWFDALAFEDVDVSAVRAVAK
jgi:phosphomannomutase